MSGHPELDSPCGVPRLRRAQAGAIAQTLRQAGCVVVEQALDPRQIKAMHEDLAPWFDKTPNGEGAFFGKKTKRFGAVFAKAPATTLLALAPEILDAIEDVLLNQPQVAGTDCIQLHLTQAIEIGPGEDSQLLHRDDDMFPFPKPCEVMVNVMWPLGEFTPENGATRLAPASQNWPRQPVYLTDEGVYDGLGGPGDAIIWLGSLVHGGGANCSLAPRRGLVISYSLGWLAQAEKLLLSIAPDIARRLPERLQRLIGYQVHRPNLGWVEGRDPKQWLDGQTGPVAAAADNLTPDQNLMLNALMGALAHSGQESKGDVAPENLLEHLSMIASRPSKPDANFASDPIGRV